VPTPPQDAVDEPGLAQTAKQLSKALNAVLTPTVEPKVSRTNADPGMVGDYKKSLQKAQPSVQSDLEALVKSLDAKLPEKQVTPTLHYEGVESVLGAGAEKAAIAGKLEELEEQEAALKARLKDI